jgi:UDP-glucose 4-epimerase
VYGQPSAEHLPVDETAPIQKALSPYGNTKQINEEIICDEAHADAQLRATILRYFNPIGAHPSALIGELPNGVPQNLLPFITQTALGIRKQLKVFGNDYDTPDGSCIRDYIYVVDLAKAHVKAVQRMLNCESEEQVEIFNLGTGQGLSVLELLNTFMQVTGVEIPYQIVDRREGDIEKVWAKPDKANNVLNWKADTPIEQVLLSAWKWELNYRNRKLLN